MADNPDTSLSSGIPEQSDGARADARGINTQGGDYAEDGIDKHQGTFVEGNQYGLSDDFRSATLYAKSTIARLG